jgi:hypothetical protein
MMSLPSGRKVDSMLGANFHDALHVRAGWIRKLSGATGEEGLEPRGRCRDQHAQWHIADGTMVGCIAGIGLMGVAIGVCRISVSILSRTSILFPFQIRKAEEQISVPSSLR